MNIYQRILHKNKIKNLLPLIPQVADPAEGFYMLYAPKDAATLDSDMICAIVFMSHDEEELYSSLEITNQGLVAVANLKDIKTVIEVALENNTFADATKIIAAINYYLDNDAYLSFD